MPGRRVLALTATCAVVLAAVAAGLIWAAFTGVGPAGEDRSALAGAIDSRSVGVTAVLVVFTNLGSTAAMAVLAVVTGVVLFVRGHRVDGVWLIATMAGASLVFTLIKRTLDRPRPPVPVHLVQAGNESLPSGHATMSMTVVGALVVLAWPHLTGPLRLGALLVAAAWIGGIGYSRIYLGVHWFSDVVAGWATGAAWLAVCTGVLLWWRARHPEPTVPV
ncbi:phosphatase PAP2 family protein [Pseudonocardia kujensis]|uniref:phosphatase PAP2 family protein n=1 Tax=Pseudonocardia kujensis TaxID=1128675 RepID=UPI001E60E9B8|nr:phosphatase PAP2 family protein [Pseudonocardia kujensis]MCE0766577.1 phosphatase PAP2 family protein [Pseudonocardia kujensis]